MYFIDEAEDVCHKTDRGRVYFYSKGSGVAWLYYEDWDDFNDFQREQFKSRKLSNKSLILNDIPIFYIDKSGNWI